VLRSEIFSPGLCDEWNKPLGALAIGTIVRKYLRKQYFLGYRLSKNNHKRDYSKDYQP
jgi:hypothetical protein